MTTRKKTTKKKTAARKVVRKKSPVRENKFGKELRDGFDRIERSLALVRKRAEEACLGLDRFENELAKIEGIRQRCEEIVAVVERSEILLTKMDARIESVLFRRLDSLAAVEDENIGAKMAQYAPKLLDDIASVSNAFVKSEEDAVNTIATSASKDRPRAVVVEIPEHVLHPSCEHVGCERPMPHEHEIGGPCAVEVKA